MKLFGTDGIRGMPGRSPLTDEEIRRIGEAYRLFLGKGKTFICRDTRSSGERISKLLTGTLTSSGVEVRELGILNTGGAAYLARKFRIPAIIVSASHNPADENGIKFLTSEGSKLTDQQEHRIEALFYSQNKPEPKPAEKLNAQNNIEDYISFASKLATSEGMRLVVDCANGAAYKTAPKTLRNIKAETIVINANPNGLNINKDCGSEHPQALAKKVLNEKADLGIAFDGDADRASLIDEKGNILDGDIILGISSVSMAKHGKLKNGKIVATQYSNYGLEISLNRLGIGVVRSDVGDRSVAEALQEHGLKLGGEKSGHIIFPDILPTGDGIITALQIISVINEEGKTLSELASRFEMLPQAMINVKVKEKKPIETLKLHNSIKEAEELLKGKGRLYVRYSGTQSVLRIMVEGKSEKQINNIARELGQEAEKELQ